MLKVTKKEWAAVKSGIDSLFAMAGTLDENFNRECKAANNALNKISKRNGQVQCPIFGPE